MALTKIPRGLLDTGIADSSDATAITIDSSENVTVAGHIRFADDKKTIFGAGDDLHIYHSGGHNYIDVSTPDQDLIFKGTDGGSDMTALTLDMSEGGAAAFNSSITATAVYGKGDTDSGIKFLGSNEIAIDTMGQETIRFDAQGRVGIGTNDPHCMLHIYAADNQPLRVESTDAYAGIELKDNGSAELPPEISALSNDFIFYGGHASSRPELMRLSSDGTVRFGTVSVERMRINTSGYVGIGETSPAKALHIKGGSWNTAGITLERTDNGASNDSGITFKSAAGANDAYGLGSMWFQNALDSNAYAMIRARTDDSSGTSGRLEFVTSTSAVGNGTAAAMTIDSAGTVTQPNNPVASYGHATNTEAGCYNYNYGGTGAQTITCIPTSAVINVGNHFNTSTGKFTCPVAGIYKCEIHGNFYTHQIGDGNFYRFSLRKNSTTHKYHYHANEANSSIWFYHSYIDIISCAAGDTLYWNLDTNNLLVAQGGFGWDAVAWATYDYYLVQ